MQPRKKEKEKEKEKEIREKEMSSSKHIVIVPANAQGHIIPTLTFVKKLAARRSDFTITIATTPLNAQFIRSTILTDNSSNDNNTSSSLSLSSSSSDGQYNNIRVVDAPFQSSDYGLPPNIENSDSLPVAQLPLLVLALFQTMPAHFHSLISSIIAEEGHPPLCVISDLLIGWAVGVTKSFQVPNFSLVLSGAFGTTACLSFWQHLPHRRSADMFADDHDDEYTLPGLPEKYRFKSSDLLPFIRETDGSDDWSKFYQGAIYAALNSDGWLCNAVEEIEGNGLEILRQYTKLPIWAIGPLIPSTMLDHNYSSTSSLKVHGQHGVIPNGAAPSKCMEWLEVQSQGSVIYISFGSLHTISSFQMMELAKGLEESGHPFIWVIKPPFGFDKNEEFRGEWLPEKFEEKMAKTGQGFLIHGWAPQLEILSHKSTGAFLSHCGWNSVLESLSQGVPIIGWPMADDQKYNLAYLMEEMGVCVKLAGGFMSVIRSEEVSRVLNLMMDKNEGKRGEMRKKLDEIVERMRGAVREEDGCGHVKGSFLKAMDDFIDILEKREKERTSITGLNNDVDSIAIRYRYLEARDGRKSGLVSTDHNFGTEF